MERSAAVAVAVLCLLCCTTLGEAALIRSRTRARASVRATVSHRSSLSAAADTVCSRSLKASFASLFNSQDDPGVIAEDENTLCDLCLKVSRVAIGSVNDERYAKTWQQNIVNQACKLEDYSKSQDCETIASAITRAQTDYFTSDAVKISDEEKNTTELLSAAIARTALRFCKGVKCCRQAPKPIAGAVKADKEQTDKKSNQTVVNSEQDKIDQSRAMIDKDKQGIDLSKRQLDAYHLKLNREQKKAK